MAFNDWLETNDFIVDGVTISHFERKSDGRLVPIPHVVIGKEGPVAEILHQLQSWNKITKQHGVCTSSWAALKVKAPDVAFTPKDIYCGLDAQQLDTFQGAPFYPIFVVEVDDLSTASKLNTLTSKFLETYFPAGVELGWLVDPINKTIFTFKKESDDVVGRRPHQWYDSNNNPGVLSGGEVLH